MHALVPLTFQEGEVEERLNLLHMEYAIHKVFQLGDRSIVPDFFLPRFDLVIECWRSDSRRGVALGWAERNALYVNLKFKRLKELHPAIRCLGLAEVPQVDAESLTDVVGGVMLDADFMVYSMEDFELAMKVLLGQRN